MKKTMKNDSPVSKVSLKLMKIQRKNLTSLGPRWEQSFSVFADNPNSVLNEMWFLTIDPFIGIPVFHRKAFRAIILLACSRGLSLSKNISNSLTYTIASSCVCTSPLAVMTIVGLHDFVKVSISASLRSFLLIMCIDAPESTTNSFSSGFKDDARWHLFSGDEKNVAFSCSFNLNTLFGQLPRCFAGT